MSQSKLKEEIRSEELEALKFRLEQTRYRMEIAKWIIIACGAIISFYVLDLGRLKLEEFRVSAENERQLLNAYLTATESAQPDIWKRKLRILKTISNDKRMQEWAQNELEYIETFAAIDALYRETLRVTSLLVAQRNLNDPERVKARVRFSQIYWSELLIEGESQDVEKVIIQFKKALELAEQQPKEPKVWNDLNIPLYELSMVVQKVLSKIKQHPGSPSVRSTQRSQ